METSKKKTPAAPVQRTPLTMQQPGMPVEDEALPYLTASVPHRTAPAEPSDGLQKPMAEEVDSSPAIGVEELRKATERLLRYQRGKASLDQRIVRNEQWWKMRHWAELRARYGEKEQEPLEPTSAWLLNCVLNKHADAMDNFPSVNVLPQAEDDVELAKMLSDVVPVLLAMCKYEAVYDDKWWYKIKQGTGVEMVYWDTTAHNGLGEVGIKTVDLLKLAWEPGVRSIQDSDDVFCMEVMTLEQLKERYPEAAGEVTGGTSVTVLDYEHDDARDTGDQVVVVDWYYKARTESGRTVLHLCKYVGDTILFASENMPEFRQNGFYRHGKYPFVLDPLFPVQDSVAGMGYVDIMRDPQLYIDQMDSMILRNAQLTGRKRYFIADGSGVNEKEFADWTKDFVHVAGSLDETMIREIDCSALNTRVYDVRQMKIDELKETSGNRDFNQGGTTSGVTAASAIAALQESGNKLSRDMVKASYRAFEEVCELVIELIRQFYNEPRTFRITGKSGGMSFVSMDNSAMLPPAVMEMGVESIREPAFDLQISAQKENPFARMSQNELAVQLYQMGVFNPQMADQSLLLLDMMQFEGVDELKEAIRQRGTVFDQMQQQIAALSQQMTAMTGGMPAMGAPAQQGMPAQQGQV